jgi:hypothetical protein
MQLLHQTFSDCWSADVKLDVCCVSPVCDNQLTLARSWFLAAVSVMTAARIIVA